MSANFSEKITLGPYDYKLYYNGEDFELAYVNKPIGTHRRVDAGLVFWGDEDDLLVEDLNLNTNAFALAVAILPVMARNMAAKQPPKFTLLANSPRKIKPYQRFAKRLNRYLSHLYDMELTAKGAEFHYHKKPKHERTNLPLPETNE